MMCWSAFSKELGELVRISRMREFDSEELKANGMPQSKRNAS